MTRPRSLGSGRVYTPLNVNVVHFGSPTGSQLGPRAATPRDAARASAMIKPIIHFGSPIPEKGDNNG